MLLHTLCYLLISIDSTSGQSNRWTAIMDRYPFVTLTKFIYPKYSKHWLSTLAATIDCDCSELLIKSWFKSWVIIFNFQVFRMKKHSKLTWKSRLKSRFLFCLIFQFYLIHTLIFFVCSNGFGWAPFYKCL